jgi:hypothetical protein
MVNNLSFKIILVLFRIVNNSITGPWISDIDFRHRVLIYNGSNMNYPLTEASLIP